nr:hypothetical protein Iba_chr07bCG14990 [Ipomoea batatas]
MENWQLLVSRKLRRFGSKSKIEKPSWNLASYAFPPDSILGYGLASQSTLSSPQSGQEDWIKGKRRTPRLPHENSSGHSSDCGFDIKFKAPDLF